MLMMSHGSRAIQSSRLNLGGWYCLSSPARLCAIPGRRPIRSHSRGQSEAAAVETAPKIQPQGQRTGRSAVHHRQQSSVSHHTSTAVFVRAIATKHRNHVPFPYVPRINTTFNRCATTPERLARWAATQFFGACTWPAAALWARLWERIAGWAVTAPECGSESPAIFVSLRVSRG